MTEVSNAPSIFACPHCAEAFSPTKHGVVCLNGHSFDRAREGYLNLTIGGRLSRTAIPGDTADSLTARRRFLSTGAYGPIAHAVAELVGDIDGAVLDVGCGEGYYLSHIGSAGHFGLDISKRAIQMSSKLLPHAQFVVGNAYRLPVLDQSCDAVFSVFAPHSLEEFQRVLTKGGQWVTATPASRHLQQMRPKRDAQIIEREQRRDSPPPYAINAQRIQFDLELTDQSANDLFSMTPLVWQTAAEATPVHSVSVDVWVSSGITS